MLELADKDIKIVIICVFSMFQKVSIDLEEIKKIPNVRLEIKNYNVWDEKDSGWIKSWFNIAKVKISKLCFKMKQKYWKIKKLKKKEEKHISESQDNFKWLNMGATGALEVEEKGTEKNTWTK